MANRPDRRIANRPGYSTSGVDLLATPELPGYALTGVSRHALHPQREFNTAPGQHLRRRGIETDDTHARPLGIRRTRKIKGLGWIARQHKLDVPEHKLGASEATIRKVQTHPSVGARDAQHNAVVPGRQFRRQKNVSFSIDESTGGPLRGCPPQIVESLASSLRPYYVWEALRRLEGKVDVEVTQLRLGRPAKTHRQWIRRLSGRRPGRFYQVENPCEAGQVGG